MAFIPTTLSEISLFTKTINCIGELLDCHLNRRLGFSFTVIILTYNNVILLLKLRH